jgi:hypothetical protein
VRNRVRLFVYPLVGVAIAAAGAFYGVWRATQQTPEFYQTEMQKDPVKLVADGEAMEKQVLQFHNEVRRTGRWEAIFTDEQINGWLAVDLPEKFPRALPRGVSEPRIVIQEEEAVVACRYKNPKIATVFSMGVEVSLTGEPNVVAVRIRKARAGLMPISLKQLLEHATKYAYKSDVPLRWMQIDGDPVALVTVPAEHEDFLHRITIETINLRDGEVYLAGRTEESELASPPMFRQASMAEREKVQR